MPIVKAKKIDGQIFQLFSLCMYKADSKKIQETFDQCIEDKDKDLYLWQENMVTVGLISLSVHGDKIVINHIACLPSMRHKKIATRLVDAIKASYSDRPLEAETDDDALGFYRARGFAIESLGEKYPGIVRYVCRLV